MHKSINVPVFMFLWICAIVDLCNRVFVQLCDYAIVQKHECTMMSQNSTLFSSSLQVSSTDSEKVV